MGRVKAMLMEEQEQAWEQLDSEFKLSNPHLNPHLSGLENTEQAIQQYEKEFEDWLDFFENKYGGGE